MKYLSLIWNILTNVITLIIVSIILTTFTGSFENIVVSILILIYINIVSFFSLWGRQKHIELMAFNYEFKQVRILLKEKLDEYSKELEEEQLNLAQENFKKQTKKFYINSFFAFLIYIFAILNLLSNLI